MGSLISILDGTYTGQYSLVYPRDYDTDIPVVKHQLNCENCAGPLSLHHANCEYCKSINPNHLPVEIFTTPMEAKVQKPHNPSPKTKKQKKISLILEVVTGMFLCDWVLRHFNLFND